jgi:hypothetical protein
MSLPLDVDREDDPGPNLFLIPGGRYLVTADLDYVRLVDLGAPGRAPLETPLEVAKIPLDLFDELLREIHLLAWEHEETGSLRVAVGIEPTNGRLWVCSSLFIRTITVS